MVNSLVGLGYRCMLSLHTWLAGSPSFMLITSIWLQATWCAWESRSDACNSCISQPA